MIDPERCLGTRLGATVAPQDEPVMILVEREKNRSAIVVHNLAAGQLTIPFARNRQIRDADAEVRKAKRCHTPAPPLSNLDHYPDLFGRRPEKTRDLLAALREQPCQFGRFCARHEFARRHA